MGDPAQQEILRAFLMGEPSVLARARSMLRHVPHGQRCKLCNAPFEGPGGAVLRHVGFARFSGNPAICSSCIKGLQKIGVYGAEIPVSLLFADVRGSTTIGEHMRPSEFRAFLDRFYRVSSQTILEHDGIVDKFVGDEAIGLFFVGISGPRHAAAAIAAGEALLERLASPDVTSIGPIPIGAAVHTGEAYVGSTGAEGAVTDFTAIGDVVNTTARLAGEARAGELLVSIDAATAAGFDAGALDRRVIDVRGRIEPVEVVSVQAPTQASGARRQT